MIETPKKICLIVHSLGIGGMERVMAELATNFSNREKTQVDIVLIGRKKENVYSLSPSINIHRPSFYFENSRRTIYTLRTIQFLRSEVKSIDPDTVLSFGEYWNNLVLVSLYGLSYPVFISDRSEPGKNLGRLQNFLRRRLYPKAAGYIAQTKDAQQVCLQEGWNDNVQVIGNPIRVIDAGGPGEKENIVLSVGRLIRTKHFDQLIRMFQDIGKPGWKLVIVGGDAKKMHLSSELKKIIRELNAEDNVFLEGEQKDIDSYYRKSKIFAFTSSSEGFPNVIGEALAAGLPVVSYDCVSGPSDMIKDGRNGFLIPLFDSTMFKEKLSKLMENERLREQMSDRAKESVKSFSSDFIADMYYKFITTEN